MYQSVYGVPTTPTTNNCMWYFGVWLSEDILKYPGVFPMETYVISRCFFILKSPRQNLEPLLIFIQHVNVTPVVYRLHFDVLVIFYSTSIRAPYTTTWKGIAANRGGYVRLSTKEAMGHSSQRSDSHPTNLSDAS